MRIPFVYEILTMTNELETTSYLSVVSVLFYFRGENPTIVDYLVMALIVTGECGAEAIAGNNSLGQRILPPRAAS